jgi:hypothetical protein
VKRTRLKRIARTNQKKTETELWKECRRIVFEQYGTDCYTCGARNLQGRNLQCGHMWAKASVGAYLKYDIRILRPQCARCNLFLGGQGAIFYKRMLKEEGKEYMARLELDRQVTVKASDYYTKLLAEYKTIAL